MSPVGLIIGQYIGLFVHVQIILTIRTGGSQPTLDRQLPHAWNAMGYFLVSHIWSEKINGHAGLKVRFEKLDLAQKSWWSAKGSPLPPPLEERDFVLKPENIQCQKCKTRSFRVYSEGWMCLERGCTQFWKINNSDPPTTLTFHAGFLNTRFPPGLSSQPPLPFTSNPPSIGIGTVSEVAWRGIVCPKCQRCIPCTRWSGWKCPCKKFLLKINRFQVDILTVDGPQERKSQLNGPIKTTRYTLTPRVDDDSISPYQKITYSLGVTGSVTHIVADKEINGRPGGPNDMFDNLQAQANELGLRRYKVGASKGEEFDMRMKSKSTELISPQSRELEQLTCL